MGRINSGKIFSVTKREGGRAVVADKSFIQPLPTFELSPICVPGMSESSDAPNLFSDSCHATSRLRPSNDCGFQTSLSEELSNHLLRDWPVVTQLKFFVFENLEQYRTRFDAGCFPRMQIDENDLPVLDGLKHRRDTTITEWDKHWNHWCGVVLLAIVFLGRRQICCLHSVMKKWITNEDR